jgi:hypothetical protein
VYCFFDNLKANDAPPRARLADSAHRRPLDRRAHPNPTKVDKVGTPQRDMNVKTPYDASTCKIRQRMSCPAHARKTPRSVQYPSVPIFAHPLTSDL